MRNTQGFPPDPFYVDPIFGMTVPPRLAGIDTKKEASEIQKPLSGDRRSRTDDPLLAKQML